MINSEGVIQGEFVHHGVEGGSFVLTPEASGSDETGFLQLDIHKHKQVAAESAEATTLKAGASYKGELKHPSFPNQDLLIRLDLTSPTGGLWRDVSDNTEDEQKFTV